MIVAGCELIGELWAISSTSHWPKRAGNFQSKDISPTALAVGTNDLMVKVSIPGAAFPYLVDNGLLSTSKRQLSQEVAQTAAFT